jgi:hypothetical protein
LKIIESAVSDVHYADHAKPSVGGIVVRSYVEALTWTHGTTNRQRNIVMYADNYISSFVDVFFVRYRWDCVFDTTQAVTHLRSELGRSIANLTAHLVV